MICLYTKFRNAHVHTIETNLYTKKQYITWLRCYLKKILYIERCIQYLSEPNTPKESMLALVRLSRQETQPTAPSVTQSGTRAEQPLAQPVTRWSVVLASREVCHSTVYSHLIGFITINAQWRATSPVAQTATPSGGLMLTIFTI